MDGLIIWQLLDAFLKMLVLTRVAQYLLRKTSLTARKRAYTVFFSITVITFIGLFLTFKVIQLTFSIWLFYYVPFLVMWLLKDLMDASRKEKEEAQEVETE